MSIGSTLTSQQADALRAKYRAERDRRIRPDGDAQYTEVSGKFASFVARDPNLTDEVDRSPINDHVQVAIVGGGWAGLLSAARLKEAGITDFRIIDDAATFGGTWYWNRYPGAQCDIESYCYMPLLEETGYVPKEKYSFAAELFEHAQRIADVYELHDRALFRTRVTAMAWDDEQGRWTLRTNRGDAMTAQFVMCCSGPFHRPKLPGTPGLDRFEGHVFHTSRWDYDYTGGDHDGGLTKLRDKRVAIIGTGATAVQCVPFLGEAAEHLYVFQRTPSSVDLRGNKPTDPAWAASLQSGWQKARRDNFNDIVRGAPFDEDLVSDGWTDIFRRLKAASGAFADPSIAVSEEEAELADFEKMGEIRARAASVVKDPRTAELLKPYYRQFCKRPCFNDDYLPTFNRPNVTLVDTSETHGVERITANGIVVGNQEYAVDCIIYATGFEAATPWRRRIGMDIRGRDDLDLFDYWDKGLRTLHGHSVHNFPNWFYIGLSQVGASFNFCAIADEVARHVSHIISETARRGDHAVIEATAEGEAAWVGEIHRLAVSNDAFLEGCTPGYYNNEGGFRTTTQRFNGDFYAPGATEFAQLLSAWRDRGMLDGMNLREAGRAAP